MPDQTDQPPSGGSDPLSLEILRDMTEEQIDRGLFPKTFADLRYRASAFSRIDPDKLNNPPNKAKAKKT